jgi:glycosyltransferase involved in cell wall biosynthesis
MPRVSVIITCFNHEKYISESINSVLEQTYQDFEIIVINDGSTDNSSEVIRKIYEANKNIIRFIDHKINIQPRFSGNEGIELAKGDFIAWNDGDDVWYPSKLEKQMKLFEMHSDKSVGLVYCYGNNINENSLRRRDEIQAVKPSKNVFSQLFMGAFFFKNSQLVRREVYDKVGLHNEEYRFLCADYELMLRIAAAGYKFDLVPEILAGHRIHDRNGTINRSVAQLKTKEMLSKIAQRYERLILEGGIDVPRRLAICDLAAARYNFIKGNTKECRSQLWQVLKVSPSMILSKKSTFALLLLSIFPYIVYSKLKLIKPFNKLFIAY